MVLFRYIDDLGIAAGLGIWTMVVLSISLYAAKSGDDAWEKVVRLLFWSR